MNSSVLSRELYETALTKSWAVPLDVDKTFPPKIVEWLKNKAKELGVPFVYVAYPLITATAHCLGVSQVRVTNNWLEPIIIYALVSGRSGTNKSGALSSIKRIVDNALDETDFFDSGTLEGLMDAMTKDKTSDKKGVVLSFVDEFATFLDSLDKNSPSNAERSRYLSLWSG